MTSPPPRAQSNAPQADSQAVAATPAAADRSPGRVLPTLNEDGSRRWLRPKCSPGRFLTLRQWFGWTLIAIFTVIPYVEIAGKPAMLLDIMQREFTLFGTTFLATDTLFLMLFLVGSLATIFLLTALFGRVWCGWACPQTVYLELLFRPLERLIEGGHNQQLRLDRDGPTFRRFIKYPIFLVIAMFLAHTFLAYFVGVDQLFQWVQGSPFEHPVAFLVMAAVTGAMFFDFTYFREQTCLVACPYGRFQSALLDRDSLIVGYDAERGEPRGKPKQSGVGDCIDCQLCVQTCPTGIDIRNGLQMECVNCTQCIDACDAVMDKLKRPRGLIRYSSQRELAGEKKRFLRPRVVLYPLLVLLAFGSLGFMLTNRELADVTVLRGIGMPFSILDDGRVSNSIRIKLVNRDDVERSYRVTLLAPDDFELITPTNPVTVAVSESKTIPAFVNVPREAFVNSRREIEFVISDGASVQIHAKYQLLGPRNNNSNDNQENDNGK